MWNLNIKKIIHTNSTSSGERHSIGTAVDNLYLWRLTVIKIDSSDFIGIILTSQSAMLKMLSSPTAL